MKRIVFLATVCVLGGALALASKSLFPRPLKEVAGLIEPILYERLRADDYHYERGSPAWNLGEDLEKLTKNDSLTISPPHRHRGPPKRRKVTVFHPPVRIAPRHRRGRAGHHPGPPLRQGQLARPRSPHRGHRRHPSR